MAMNIHRSLERGVSEHGWLHSRFSFSFADYQNPERMGFGALRVLNDDIIDPGYGFDTHPHSNYEIVTIVLEGSVEHGDSMGNTGIIHAGELQRISAGSGILHSEKNPSKKEKTALLQIWIKPKELNIEPSYEQKKFSAAQMKNKLVEVVSGTKRKGAIYIHQDARFLLGALDKKKSAPITISKSHGLFVFVIEGSVRIGDASLDKRDCAEITGEEKITIAANEKSKVLAIEVPMR
ncbi:MAG TPA: pirin family protein [archaeon]|nr:pirin family protein [archaeon]